jgi:L-asparaginase
VGLSLASTAAPLAAVGLSLASTAAPLARAGRLATPPAPGGLHDQTPAAPPESAARPRVRLIATGGTISNRTGGRLTAAELVGSIPDLANVVRAEPEQYSNVASSQLTLDDFLRISRRINDLYRQDAELAGVVVTSGTDTLEELAYFLHLTVRDERPVAVVGSMRNPSTVGYEGAANLLAGFRVAAEPASRGLGTVVVLNDEINSAREVTKTDALRLHTFQSRGAGPLGVVDADRVVYSRQPVRRRGASSEFDVSGIERLPRVDVLLVYQDAPGDLIKAAVDLGARGLVIATAGAGATSGTQNEGLNYAAEKGVFVAITTRTGGGRIAPPRGGPGGGRQPSPEQQRRRAFSVAAGDLAPVKARLLLMLGLTKTHDRDELQRMFDEY